MSSRPVRRNAELRASFFRAAQEILGTEGYGGLKLAAVCKRLSVTTGSFYHSFDSWQEFTDALLDDWVEERTTQLIELARAQPEPVEKLRLLAQVSSELMHRTEAAIRVWAAVDPRVRERQERVDVDRYQIVLEGMRGLVGDALADRYTVLAMSTLIGFEMISAHADRADLDWSLETILAKAVTEDASSVG